MHTPAARLHYLDGLRGVAALGVAVCHASAIALGNETVRASVPFAVRETFRLGRLGVPIFFVLSGFVIAYALRETRITPSTAGRFFLRRSLRLDIPYWSAIGLSVATTAAIARLAGDAIELPDGKAILAHVFYLQAWLGIPHITNVFWTLCIEVQFYLSFVLLLAIAQLSRLPPGLVALAPFIASLFLVDDGPRRLFLEREVSIVPYVAMFYLGITACYGCLGRGWLWFAFGVVGTSVRLLLVWDDFLGAGVATSLFIVSAHRNTLVGAPLCRPSIQFLGMISYSLYLVHWPVERFVTLVVFHFRDRTAAAGWIAMPTAVIASVAVAYLFFLTAERLGLWLAKRVGR